MKKHPAYLWPASTECYAASEVDARIAELEGQNAALRRALTSCRAQWIHSINARRCLEALGELPPADDGATS